MNPTKTLIRCTAQSCFASLSWQQLKFGFERAVFTFYNRDTMERALKKLEKSKNLSIIRWSTKPSWSGFEGTIFVMGTLDKEAFEKAQKLEQDQVESWWQRYHAADYRTKKLMARGAIE